MLDFEKIAAAKSKRYLLLCFIFDHRTFVILLGTKTGRSRSAEVDCVRVLFPPSLSCCTWRFVGRRPEATQIHCLTVWNFPSNNPLWEHANRVEVDRATERGLVRDWAHLSPSSLPFVSCVLCALIHCSCGSCRCIWVSSPVPGPHQPQYKKAALRLVPRQTVPMPMREPPLYPFCTGAPVTGSLPGRWLFFSGGLGPSLLLLQWTASALLDRLLQFERIQPWTGLPCLCRAQIRTLKWTRWM